MALLDVDLVRPSFSSVPAWSLTDGGVAAEISALAGYVPDPEQRLVLDGIFARRQDDVSKVAAFEVAIICARQNLKTAALKQACLAWLLDESIRLIVWSAHEFRTAQEAFRDMDDLIHSHPSLASRVRKVWNGNGDEAIEMHSGQRLIFKARTKGGGRGLSGDRVVLDEAFALKPSHMGALLPTLSARPDPQVIYASSAGLVDSEVLRSIRDRGRHGGDPSLAYFEWADPAPGGCSADDCDHRLGVAGCVLDDVSRWQLANPALGRRISVDYVAAERRALPPDEFARERLGWWDEPSESTNTFDSAAWVALTDANVDVRQLSNIVLGVDVAPNHSSASIVAAAWDKQRGCPVVELVERRSGSSWLVDRLIELRSQYSASVALNSSGPVGSLIPQLGTKRVEWVDVRGSEYARACGLLAASVNGRDLRHRGESEFAAAVLGVRARKVGDGFAFSRSDSSVDISPVVASAIALWMVSQAPKPTGGIW